MKMGWNRRLMVFGSELEFWRWNGTWAPKSLPTKRHVITRLCGTSYKSTTWTPRGRRPGSSQHLLDMFKQAFGELSQRAAFIARYAGHSGNWGGRQRKGWVKRRVETY